MLEKLRAKSERVKRIMSLGFTVAVFGGILFVWVSSWSAQTQTDEIQSKTESPMASFSLMIEGLVSDINDAISGTPSFVKNDSSSATSSSQSAATTTDNFDLSGVVVIDPSASTTPDSSSQLPK